MTAGHILLPSPAAVDRRQPLLGCQDGSLRRRKRFAEVAGGTTAECAAVCCCFPCGLMNLLVLILYKLPAGLCRKALQRRRRLRMIKKGLLQQKKGGYGGYDGTELQIHPVAALEFWSMKSPFPSSPLPSPSPESDMDVLELEKEMWNRFYSTGFWRSPSQRSDICNGK